MRRLAHNQFFRFLTGTMLFLIAGPTCFAGFEKPSRGGLVSGESKISRKDGYEVKQLVNPGFENLPLDRKLLIYWLSKAVEAGETIAWKQMSRDGLDIRRLFEQIWLRKAQLTEREKNAIENYYFEILLFNGLYDHHSEKKFVLKDFTADQFRALVARLGIVDSRIDRLVPAILDPDYRPTFGAPVSEDPSVPADLILGAGSDFYQEGMTQSQVRQLPRRLRQLNRNHPHLTTYPYIRTSRGGRRRPSAMRFRVGGLFSEELSRIVDTLEKAKPYARARELALINAYQKALRSGRSTDYLAAEVLWLKTNPEDVDFVLGFIESYNDPLGLRGTFESAMVLMANSDPEDVRRGDALRAGAPIYEQAMPVEPRFRKEGIFAPPQAEGAYLLHWIGGGMLGGPRGFNLPNSNLLRETVGSRSFTLFNKLVNMGSDGPEFKEDELAAFYLPEVHALLKETGRLYPMKIHVEFHEVTGHGSGRNDPGVSPEGALGDLYNMMEECRAESAAIYHILDFQRLVDLKIVAEGTTYEAAKKIGLSQATQFFTDHLISYRRMNEKGEIRQAHQVGRQVMLNRAIADGAIEIVLSDTGFPRVLIKDTEKLRESIGRLWFLIQEIKGTGNKAKLEQLIQANWNLDETRLNWRDSAIKTFAKIDQPKYSLYLNPTFRLVRGPNGQVIDVAIDYLPPSTEGISVALDFETKKKAETCETGLGGGYQVPF